MKRRWLMAAILLALAVGPARAEESPGQADLDAATEKKIEAKTLGDLGDVVNLCEKAIKKGLSDDGKAFANQLLSSTLLQRGDMLTRPIFEQSPPSRQWPQLRMLALQDLEKAIAIDDSLGEAHLLIAKLQLLPDGDEEKAKTSVAKAVEAFAEKPREKSDALVQLARLQAEPEERLKFLNQAIEAFPDNDDALRVRGLHYIDADEFEKGLADLMKVLEIKPDDIVAHQAAAQALTSLEKFDEALEHLNKSIDLNDKTGNGYILRARLQAAKGDNAKAEEDLNAALKVNPTNLAALLMRAELRARDEKFDLAEGDINRALELQPDIPQAILLRAGIYAAQEKFNKAIADLETLLKLDPTNAEIRLQIGSFYVADGRPNKAIEIFSEIVKDEPDNWMALRSRGDGYLSTGRQAEAIADFEAALKLKEDSDGLLNNLAWVLATSTDDKLRDGKRAIELATKACELSDYKAAHILSTLASAYAESGDWENAIKWSTKAVELGKETEIEQLKQELKSYEEKKPWRELQNVKEKPEPEKTKPEDLDL
jgi:tetratricopeptide (TPR) repeat protein